jgi:hypothetical protein
MAQKIPIAALFVALTLLSFARVIQAQSNKKPQIGANLTIEESGAWRAVHKGIEFRKLVLERSEPSYVLELKLLRIDPKAILPRILHSGQFQLKGADAKTFVEKSGALAAINANYFDEKGRALAYLKTGSQEINRNVSKHSLYTGIFAIRDATPMVLQRDEFQPAHAGEALQSGPLLLHRGAPVEIMRGLGRYARRALVGIDKEGRIIAGATDAVNGGLSFAELQELFGNSKWQLETPDLLNLDGGGSAQLYVKADKFEQWVVGTAEVPVAIGFFAKPN